MSYKAIRKDVCEANRELERRGLVSLDEGGASAIDREQGLVVVKPAGVSHATLTPEQLVVLDLNGRVVEGSLAPAPDVAAHVWLYQSILGIGAIVSTFSPYATMFAQACRPIPCLGVVQARSFKGDIPVTRVLRKPEIERQYEKSLAAVIIERFSRLDSTDIPGVLVAQHGAYAWGVSPEAAVTRAAVIEKAAQAAFGTLTLAPQSQSIPGMLVDRHFAGR